MTATAKLKAKVEAASGGKQTVLVTAKGQPTYMNVFNRQDFGPEGHPAFTVGGVVKDTIHIGTYQAVIIDGEAVSLPGQDPANCITYDQAKAACFAAGPGHHMVTNWEWAFLAGCCIKNGNGQLHGNTNSGKSHLDPSEAGQVSTYGRTLTGSGPDAWRHDGTPFGVADLVGNVWEWVDGLKLIGGKIFMVADNDFMLPEVSWPDVGARMIGRNGIAISNAATQGGWASSDFSVISSKPGYGVPAALEQAYLCPDGNQDIVGRCWVDSSKNFEALPIRGGGWSSGDDAGLAALGLHCERSLSSINLGFRPAFIG